MMVANYIREQAHFRKLFDDAHPEQIMLIHGEAGTGKTTLVNHFMTRLKPKHCHHVNVQLRSHAVGAAEVMYRTMRKVGHKHCGEFKTQIARFQQTPNVQVGGNIIGAKTDISIALHAANPTDRKHRLSALTDALFYDVEQWNKPLLFAFDKFENATAETVEWVSGPLLSRVAESPKLRALIAGQKVPEVSNIEWSHCCSKPHKLYGVRDAVQWLPVVEAMGKEIPVPDPLSFLAGICYAHHGNPSEIMKLLDQLPNRGVSA